MRIHPRVAVVAGLGATLLAAFLSLSTSAEVPSFYAKAYFGDSIAGLNNAESAAFERGAHLFAKTWPASPGRSRNAASCVTCHSVPASGGSGMSNTALVATSVKGGKSSVHYNVSGPASGFEARRTPPLFGLGLIAESDQLRQPDGTRRRFLGALGEHDSLEDAVRHAAKAELGLRIPDLCAKTIGEQAECQADISDKEIQDLVLFIRYLAAPPRLYVRSDTLPGSTTFAALGCAACHAPTFSTTGSAFERLRARHLEGYTDLRMHDVGGNYKVRTTPLWGLNSYGPPYWHDGSAPSIDGAIRLHGGDATTAREKYERLPDEQRDALLAFLKTL